MYFYAFNLIFTIRVFNGGNTCFIDTTIIVKATPPTPTAPTATATQPTCAVSTGTINVSAPATGVTYSFDNGATYGTSATSAALAAGTYQVKVKNTVGCESAATQIIIEEQPPTPTLIVVSAVCSPNLKVYTITFASTGTLTSTAGTVDNTAKIVSGIAAGTNVILTATLGACTFDLPLTAPDCNCMPVTNPVSGGDKTICEGDVVPNLTVIVGTGESANWYSDTTLVRANSLTYTPSTAGTYLAEAFNTTTDCKSAGKIGIKLIVNPKPTITAAMPKCSVTGLTYNVKFTTSTGSVVTASSGTIQGDSVINVTAGTNVKLIVTDNDCRDSLTVVSPTCLIPLGSIGNYVFYDNDESNTQTQGDSPVVGVTVYLLNSAGAKIDSTTTRADGQYLFANLPLGIYSVQFVAPAGQKFVTANVGTDPATDSNAGVNGVSSPVTLTATMPDVITFDAGIQKPCATPTPPALNVANNICPATRGSINTTTACGAGTHVEYSTDNGTTWSATAPTYGSSPITVVAKCVTDADATCFSSNSVPVTTSPVNCTPPPPATPCSITITQQTQSVCNNNGTARRAQDDYFTVSVNATAISGGAQYEVVNLADADGTGGNPLGFATYGTAVTVGSSGNLMANNTVFVLTVRDTRNNACFKTITLNPVPPCSGNASAPPPNGPCGAVPCAPIKAVKNGQN